MVVTGVLPVLSGDLDSSFKGLLLIGVVFLSIVLFVIDKLGLTILPVCTCQIAQTWQNQGKSAQSCPTSEGICKEGMRLIFLLT